MDAQQLIGSGQLLVALPVALAAGLLSFLSPCILPLLPGYLGYIGAASGSEGRVREVVSRATGRETAAEAGRRPIADPAARAAGRAERRRLLIGVALFVLGFTAVFVAMMALAASVGVWLVRYQDLITRILGAVVIVLGLVFVGRFGFLQRTVKPSLAPRLGLVGAPLLGIAFAIGWTPCTGPTLAAINALSLGSASPVTGAILGVAYALGLGIPFLLIAFGASWATRSLTFLRRHIRAINIAGGVLLIVVGLLMVTGVWTTLMYAMQAVIGGYVTPL